MNPRVLLIDNYDSFTYNLLQALEILGADVHCLRNDIVTETVEGAVVIPETALRYRGNDIYVLLAEALPEQAERIVQIGIVDGDRVQVLEGLSPGESVLLQ